MRITILSGAIAIAIGSATIANQVHAAEPAPFTTDRSIACDFDPKQDALKITFDEQNMVPTIDHDKSTKEIRAYYEKSDMRRLTVLNYQNVVVEGTLVAKLLFDVSFQRSNFIMDDGTHCGAVSKAKVRIGFSDLTILINKYRVENSCTYNALLDHEQKRAAYYVDAIRRSEERLQAELNGKIFEVDLNDPKSATEQTAKIRSEMMEIIKSEIEIGTGQNGELTRVDDEELGIVKGHCTPGQWAMSGND